MSIRPMRLLQILCLLLIANSVYTQAYTEKSMEFSSAGGIGWGVVVCIISLIVGVLICIFGISTVIPGVFIAIGFCIPLFFFIFFSFCPMQDLSDNTKNRNNQNWNVFIVWRWLYFSVMLAMLLALFAPLWILWNVTIMPQRVDSRAQKKHDEEYHVFLKEEKRKEEERLLYEEEQKQNQANANNTLHINNKNDGYLQQPIAPYSSDLPVSKKENEIKSFAVLKRKKHDQDIQPN